jgi:hypothetical protein
MNESEGKGMGDADEDQEEEEDSPHPPGGGESIARGWAPSRGWGEYCQGVGRVQAIIAPLCTKRSRDLDPPH